MKTIIITLLLLIPFQTMANKPYWMNDLKMTSIPGDCNGYFAYYYWDQKRANFCFDDFEKQTKEEYKLAISHESNHHLWEHYLTPKEKDVFEKLYWYSKSETDFNRQYSSQSAFEDFADTVSYRYLQKEWTWTGKLFEAKNRYADYIINKYY